MGIGGRKGWWPVVGERLGGGVGGGQGAEAGVGRREWGPGVGEKEGGSGEG